MSLLVQHGYTGSLANAPLVPTDKTKVYSLIQNFDENRYYLNSLLHQNPKDKRIIVHTFGDGVDHVSDAGKRISYRVSSDKGLTWGTKATLYDPTDSTYQIQDPSAGMDRKGRLHIFADCHTAVGSAGGTHELRYMYSDDNGTTVSSPVVIAAPGSSTLLTFRMYGRVIDTGGGVLLAPSYRMTEEGDFTQSERWVLRSTDYGANWTWVLVEGPTSTYRNESELLAVTSNIIFMVSRDESTTVYFMYKSVDAGLTWTAVGTLPTTVSNTIPGPCRLHKFRADNGKWFSVMYFPDKDSQDLYAIYGRLDNGIEGGIALFNTSTVTQIRNETQQMHYGDFCHYNGNMNAIGAWPREGGTFPTDNQMYYFENMATQYNTVFALIDPVTIYDKLGVPMFIGTYRGMATNTDNVFGTTDSSAQVSALKSIAPGPLSQNFTVTASSGIILDSNGLTFDGTKALTHSTSTYFNFMQFASAGVSDINYTLYSKLKIGTSSNPNALLGILGNNGSSQGNRGVSLFYDDRVSVPASDRITFQISKGTSGFIVNFINDDVITPNTFHVICMEVDLSQSVTNNKVKLYVDGTLISTTIAQYNTNVINNATFSMQIGNVGNNVAGAFFIGTIKDIVIQNAIDLTSVRTNFTQALIDSI